jgi:hypothetical protein
MGKLRLTGVKLLVLGLGFCPLFIHTMHGSVAPSGPGEAAQGYFYLFIYVWVGLEFELRASCLQSRCSIA